MFLSTERKGNLPETLIAGEDPSSSTGTIASPTSVPKGKKMAGRDGSVRETTELASNSTHDSTIADDMFPILMLYSRVLCVLCGNFTGAQHSVLQGQHTLSNR